MWSAVYVVVWCGNHGWWIRFNQLLFFLGFSSLFSLLFLFSLASTFFYYFPPSPISFAPHLLISSPVLFYLGRIHKSALERYIVHTLQRTRCTSSGGYPCIYD
ncbi:uncharacterized protein F4822DRAFT_367105 [Hypoxylon trugodes]|uniref:uncharacterized protein n=1 Tax=Hypoxylon trugodes TaxID=326681 RepID=UPI00218F7696|nr:uncharacterized protein F4822DRAFT_367105 [Hypoxylon trugodes]KAI1384566.1 hypothetical protein F4822DRAFT_367105 [Hypoxylon trugodes]